LTIRTRHVLASISSALSYNLFPEVILACSEAIQSQLVEQGVREDKILVQSTGVDEQRFVFSAAERNDIRNHYGVEEGEVLVGNVSFLRHYKGHDFIIQTAKVMPEHFKFIFVGGGDAQAELEEKIARAGLRDRFILTGHREDPERFFSALDIVFFASYESEGISQSFIQGLLYGLPLLCCRTPSLLEPLKYVKQYKTVDYNDVSAARDALLALAQCLGRDEAAIAQQRQAIAKKYGLEKMVETLLRLYDDHGVRFVS